MPNIMDLQPAMKKSRIREQKNREVIVEVKGLEANSTILVIRHHTIHKGGITLIM